MLGFIDDSVADGGRKLLEVTKPLPEKGWFVNPVLLGDLPADARAVQKEIFGPVAVILPFKDTEEAIRLANDTAYGLAANVWCNDPVEARRVAEQIRAGTVWINGGGAMRPDAPFGGYGRSGVGRELGEWGMREYLEVKHIQWRGEMTAIVCRPAGRGRVLELGTMYAAPTAGRMLRDFGADVIKVEDPGTGDYARQWTPQKEGQSFGFARLNSGKRSVGIDLRRPRAETGAPAGRQRRRRRRELPPGPASGVGDRLRRALGRQPGAGDRPGLRASGRPARTGRPGFGTVAETAAASHTSTAGRTRRRRRRRSASPTRSPGMSAAMGTAMALFRRERTGQRRRRRRGALRAADVHRRRHDHELHGDRVQVQRRVGNGTGAASPRGIYQAPDGKWLSIAASNQGIAKRLFAAMGKPELIENPRYATNEVRIAAQRRAAGAGQGLVRLMPRADTTSNFSSVDSTSARGIERTESLTSSCTSSLCSRRAALVA